jgi:hypothetical protein
VDRFTVREMRDQSTRLGKTRCKAYRELIELIELAEMAPEEMGSA